MRALIDKKLLCSLYVNKRLSLTKISEYLEKNHKIKINRTTIGHQLVKYGVKLRNRHEAK
jgi:predicted HTH domain antitoxin